MQNMINQTKRTTVLKQESQTVEFGENGGKYLEKEKYQLRRRRKTEKEKEKVLDQEKLEAVPVGTWWY